MNHLNLYHYFPLLMQWKYHFGVDRERGSRTEPENPFLKHFLQSFLSQQVIFILKKVNLTDVKLAIINTHFYSWVEPVFFSP